MLVVVVITPCLQKADGHVEFTIKGPLRRKTVNIVPQAQ